MYFTVCKKTGKVRLYECVEGKQRALSRERSRHLDGQPLEVIEIFVAQFNTPKHCVVSNEQLTGLIDAFSNYYLSRGSNPSTVSCKKNLLLTYVMPYFISVQTIDPNQWIFKCVKLVDYLVDNGLSYNQIIKCNVGLTQFWNWLQDEQIVKSNTKLRLRKPMAVEKPDTPLMYSLKPDDVIKFAQNADEEMAFLALTGYFFSLRTQETLALTRTDFRAGRIASELECCKVMRGKDLYDKFAVNIVKQKSKSLKINDAKPKSGSKGWVGCFSEIAAKMIIEKIKALESVANGGPLVRFGVDWNIKRWRTHGIKNITLKDLRRASIYWLGHHTQMGLIELKSHARHNKTDTTALYLRRPNEEIELLDDLDLEA